jgi:hypothetical protein
VNSSPGSRRSSDASAQHRPAAGPVDDEIARPDDRGPGIVLTRQQLLDTVWGVDFVGDDHVLEVHIGNLRRKLGDEPANARYIETIRGVGYRLLALDR